jgi:hypothetical protein
MSKGGGQPADWDSLVPQLIHPLEPAILEAAEWTEQPLSARTVVHMCEEERSVSEAAYHLMKLAEGGALEMAYEHKVPGSFERFYALAAADDQCAA